MIRSQIQMTAMITADYSAPVSSTTTKGSASRLPRAWRKTFADMPFSSNDFANCFARSLVANRSTFMMFSNSCVRFRTLYRTKAAGSKFGASR